MIFLDTETCGLVGPIALIQYAYDDGPVTLYSPWKNRIIDTINLIEEIANHDFCGFNIAFDWFHLYKMWTVLQIMPDLNMDLEDQVEEYAELEPLGRDCLKCLKPKSALDLMLVARQGPYQSLMDREDIRIKRVPIQIAESLAYELERRIKLKNIYFAKRKDKNKSKWGLYDSERADGSVDPAFKDLVLKFAPSSALKALAVDALNLNENEVLRFGDIEPSIFAEELKYAPFAKALGSKENWNGAWPDVIRHHYNHWSYNDLARKYAELDVIYTRGLYHYFGDPSSGDVESEIAIMVACCRWRGYKVDIPGLKQLREETAKRSKKIVNGQEWNVPTYWGDVQRYITPSLSDAEKLAAENVDTVHAEDIDSFEISTGKIVLEAISKWSLPCKTCDIPFQGDEIICPKCGTLLEKHDAALKAREVLDARMANYEVNFIDKLIKAGRFHVAMEVIGALSNRMSGGGGGINAQGVKKAERIRSKFPLANDPLTILCGGDFAAFEVVLAEALYNDPDLRKELLSGKKIHAIFGTFCFPGWTYEQILASEGSADDKYTRSKSAVFAMLYGGTEHTLATRLGVDIETAKNALLLFHKMYPGVRKAQLRIIESFCSMKQLGGIGTKIEWHEPKDYVESMFGFRRYFTLENRICKTLFDLAQKPLPQWSNIKIKVTRRDRLQTVSGAVQSALYACAFAIQAANTRAAANHEIQSSGAQITKAVQKAIWDLQPKGVHNWLVQPLNIHDEIECPCDPSIVDKVKETVDATVESYRQRVPLIKMKWKIGMKTWADK